MPESIIPLSPLPPPLASPPPDLSSTDAYCIRCAYNLRGLSHSGPCPECGTPIADSLRGNLLRFSAPEYVASLHRGVFLVLAAIIVQIIAGIGAMIVTFAVGRGAVTELVTASVEFLLSAIGLYGWWLFTEPDPAFVGRDTGTTARSVVRGAVIAGAVVALLSLTVHLISGLRAGISPWLGLALSLLAFVAFAVQFFASMLYLRWLAPRLPNPKIDRRAKLLLWLGPLLYTVGLALLALGPLIALVLYWNLLDRARRDIKRIRAGMPTSAAA